MEQADTVPTVPQSAGNKGLSFRGLAEVFYKPSAFFAQLRENPKVLVVYLVLAVLTFTFWWFVKDVLAETMMKMPKVQASLQELPPETVRWMGIGQAAASSILIILGPFAAAVLGLFWGNFVFAGKAKFKQLLSVMLYGEIIYSVGMLVVLPMVLAKKSLLVSLSLGVLAASQGPESILYLALSKIDLFLIWELIAIGIGLSIIYGVPRNKGYTLSVLSMGMISILHVVFSAIGKLIF
jgi:hypothetical protein